MAILRSKTLFFTTSPRTPMKMIPEIKLLTENFTGNKWNKENQIHYTKLLSQNPYFKGQGSKKDMAFSARDRINRAPKALAVKKRSYVSCLNFSYHRLITRKQLVSMEYFG